MAIKEIKTALSFFPKKSYIITSYIQLSDLEKDANLINIKYLRKKFNVNTGYSDHVPGVDVAAKSVFLVQKLLKNISCLQDLSKQGYKLSVNYKVL